MTTVETDTPQFLWLEITGKCQLSCTHCYADSGPRGTHGSMTREDWLRVIDQAAAVGVRRVQFIGGEPTMHPALCELITHALSHDLRVEVFTNLVHVTDEQWRTFAQPGVSLATSYYSDDAGQHQAVAGRATHEQTKANIVTATGLGIFVRAGVIDVEDGQRTTEAREELVDLGVPMIGHDRLREIGRGSRSVEETAGQLCGACGNGRAAVLPDGSVSPCVMSRAFPFGNVQDSDLEAVLACLPEARQDLTERGMPPRPVGPNGRTCPPQGDDCYPNNCHP